MIRLGTPFTVRRWDGGDESSYDSALGTPTNALSEETDTAPSRQRFLGVFRPLIQEDLVDALSGRFSEEDWSLWTDAALKLGDIVIPDSDRLVGENQNDPRIYEVITVRKRVSRHSVWFSYRIRLTRLVQNA